MISTCSMDAYIFKTNRHLSPWGDPTGRTPILNVSIEDGLPNALMAAGAQRTWTDVGPDEFKPDPTEMLLATDDLWITPELAKAFVTKARLGGKPAILAISDCLFTQFSASLQKLGSTEQKGFHQYLYPLIWLPGGARWSHPDDLVEAEDLDTIEIDLKVRPMEIPVHRIFDGDGKIELPLTHLACVRVTHWMHALRANQLALLAWGGRLFNVHPHRLAWAMIRALSIAPAKVMRKLVTRGRGCEIHPSAVVEASTLGDNVKIGANAVVRYSHLGDNVRVSDQCNVQYSVLGNGATVARMGMLQSCVLYEGAHTGHYGLQLCVIGRDTFVGGECILGDFKPQGTVEVFHEGVLSDTGTNTLGCAIGHDCSILMRATFYAGRELPNGLTVIGPPRDIIAKIPDDLPKHTPLTAVDGVLQVYEPSRRTGPPPLPTFPQPVGNTSDDSDGDGAN